MKKKIEKIAPDMNTNTVNLPAGSLWRDLRAETGSSNGIEWLILYEDDPTYIFKKSFRLLYVRVVILTPEGRRYAETGQWEILHKCNLYQFETAWFSRAFAIAMSEWDSEHDE